MLGGTGRIADKYLLQIVIVGTKGFLCEAPWCLYLSNGERKITSKIKKYTKSITIQLNVA